MNKIILVGILILIISIAIPLVALIFSETTYYASNTNSLQEEIKLQENETLSIINSTGQLGKIGWSKTYDRFHFSGEDIKPSTSYFSLLNNLRLKKWEAFVIFHKNFILGFSIFDVKYMGGYMIHFANFTKFYNETSQNDTTSKSTENITLDKFAYEYLNPINKPIIPDDFPHQTRHNSQSLLSQKDFQISIENAPNDHGNQYLNTSFTYENMNFHINVKLRGKDFDSMVSLTPISEDSTLFYYNIKKYNIPIEGDGTIKINGETISSKDVLVVYDSGRGVWPVKSGWVWASGSGIVDGTKIGVNFGYGFSHPNSSRHTEDSFFVNGAIHKLSAAEVKKDEINKKWTFYSKKTETIKNSCDVTFTQIDTNSNDLDLIVGKSKFDIHYGIYEGYCFAGKEHYKIYFNGILEDKLSVW
jgi:hypothetical protein